MRLLLVALCLSVLLKLISSSFSGIAPRKSNFWDFSKDQTLEAFKATIERMVRDNRRDLLEKIPNLHIVSAEKRVWYTAAYYKTCWQANASLVSTADLEDNIDSIVLADNPAFVDDLPPSIGHKVMDPVKLAKYDAVGLARTWSQLAVGRTNINFNLEFAIKAENIYALEEYIKREIWTPCMTSVHIAIKCNAKASLLYLLNKVAKVPSAYWLSLLIKNKSYEAFEQIIKSNPDWRPSQEDIDEACAYGWKDALKFYFFKNPKLQPSRLALLRAQ
ncbi:hypothetical protein PSACC_00888, partial [Paramicrosporidium saccamoebae]